MRRFVPLIVLLAAACGSATPAPRTAAPPPASPVGASTPNVLVIPLTRTPEPGFTLMPATPFTAPTPTPTPVPCANDAAFLSDLTVPDFSQLLSGTAIDKRWSVRNSGTCDWGPDYRVTYVEGNSMGASGEHGLYPAKAGSEAVVQISMTAPTAPGDYAGKWQLRDADGKAFGPVLFIKITVIETPTAAAAP